MKEEKYGWVIEKSIEMIKITLHRLEINIISMFSSFDFSRRLYTREEKVGECLFMVISCISR